MSEIQVGQINSTDGSTAITTGADGYVSFAKTQIGGRRNLIINGAMQVAQRGTSFTGLTNGNSQYTLDRFKWSEGGSPTFVTDVTQDSDAPDGFASSWKLDVTTAQTSLGVSEQLRFDYRVEAQDCQMLNYGSANAKSITLSFWVKSNKTGTYNIWLRQPDASNRQYTKQYTVDSAGTWEYKTITWAGDTSGQINNDNGVAFEILYYLAAGTNFSSGTLSSGWEASDTANAAVGNVNIADSTSNYWHITGVQLEVGTVATPFEHRSYGEELALCQRYYQVVASGATETIGTGYFESSAVAACPTRFMTTMRASPTLYSGTGTNYYYIYSAGSGVDSFNNLLGTAIGVSGATVYTTSNVSGTAGQAGRMVTAASGGYVAFDAEL